MVDTYLKTNLSDEEAINLMKGPYAEVVKQMLSDCCFPIFWTEAVDGKRKILNSGTVTVVDTSTKIIGVTAAHVISGYKEVRGKENTQLYFFGDPVDIIDIIDTTEEKPGLEGYDLATFSLSNEILQRLRARKKIVPARISANIPQEGRGIYLAGYPANDRIQDSEWELNFGLFTGFCVARTVTHDQITCAVERDSVSPEFINIPRNHHLGGASGGPLLGLFTNPFGLVTFHLCGIISQSNSDLENVVAKRVDCIDENGNINPRGIY